MREREKKNGKVAGARARQSAGVAVRGMKRRNTICNLAFLDFAVVLMSRFLVLGSSCTDVI